MHEKEKQQILFNKIIEYSFLALVIVQVCFLAYYNLTDFRYSMDHDMANGYYHFKQMIQHHSINIPDWHNTTTLELDTTFLFALPFYAITHNMFLASGLSNMVYVALYIAVTAGILHIAKVDRTFTYFTIVLVLTPYTFGMLDYMNMLFFGIMWYTVKTIVPLLLVLLIIYHQKKTVAGKKQKILYYCILLGYSFLLFLTTFSTGMYTMMCGIFPVFLYMLIDIYVQGSFKGKYSLKHLLIFAATCIAFLVGYHFYGSIFGGESRGDMPLTIRNDFWINLWACIIGVFELFGAVPYEEIQAVSFEGIGYCLRFGLVILFLIAFFTNLPTLIKKSEHIGPKKYLTVLFLFDFLILTLSNTRYSTNTTIEYRYFIIGCVPLILLLGIQLYEWFSQGNPFQKNLLRVALLGALIMLIATNNKHVFDHWDRSSHAVELTDYFNTLDIESVFFIDDDKTSNICRALDDNHKYGAFKTDTQTLYLSYCSYNDSTSGSFYGSKNAIAIVKDTAMTDYLPEEIASQYTKVGTVRWFDIYTSDQVYFP